jgi:hypothetical protein
MRGWDRRGALVRDEHAMRRIEAFVVSAVTTVLATRALLAATGYPQIGANGLHIAHVLFGGLLMLFALLAMLSFIGSASGDAAAVVGGVGFGLFIDEVGKFVTADNDYFYRPSIAIMYVAFVSIMLSARWIRDRTPPSPVEDLANATGIAAGGIAGGLPDRRRAEALRLIERASARGADAATVSDVRRLLARCPRSPESPAPLRLVRKQAVRLLRPALRGRWSLRVAIAVLAAQSLVGQVGATLVLTGSDAGRIPIAGLGMFLRDRPGG